MHYKDEKIASGWIHCLQNCNTLSLSIDINLYLSVDKVVNYSVTCLFTHSCVFDCLSTYSTNKYILPFLDTAYRYFLDYELKFGHFWSELVCLTLLTWIFHFTIFSYNFDWSVHKGGYTKADYVALKYIQFLFFYLFLTLFFFFFFMKEDLQIKMFVIVKRNQTIWSMWLTMH